VLSATASWGAESTSVASPAAKPWVLPLCGDKQAAASETFAADSKSSLSEVAELRASSLACEVGIFGKDILGLRNLAALI